MSAAPCFPMPPREAFFQTTIHSFRMYDNARLLPFFFWRYTYLLNVCKYTL